VRRTYISPSLDINYNYKFCYHCFFPPLAGLFTFVFDTSQMIVKFCRRTWWPQSFTSHMMRCELNLEFDNSPDKSDKKQVLLSVKGGLNSKYK